MLACPNPLQMASLLSHHALPRPCSRSSCFRDADNDVTEFKTANQRIDALCKAIGDMVLVNVEKKKIYQHQEFQVVQNDHITVLRDKSQHMVTEISEVMASMYQVRRGRGRSGSARQGRACAGCLVHFCWWGRGACLDCWWGRGACIAGGDVGHALTI